MEVRRQCSIKRVSAERDDNYWFVCEDTLHQGIFFLKNNIAHFPSIVIGEPFDDPKGRWRVGGGVNVPIQVVTSTMCRSGLNTLGAELQNMLRIRAEEL